MASTRWPSTGRSRRPDPWWPAPAAVPPSWRYDADGRRVVELRLDLARSPLVLTPAFPILIADALDWLSGRDLETATFDAGRHRRAAAAARRRRGATRVVGPGDTVDARRPPTPRAHGAGHDDRRGVSRAAGLRPEAPFVVNPVTRDESDVASRRHVGAGRRATALARRARPSFAISPYLLWRRPGARRARVADASGPWRSHARRPRRCWRRWRSRPRACRGATRPAPSSSRSTSPTAWTARRADALAALRSAHGRDAPRRSGRAGGVRRRRGRRAAARRGAARRRGARRRASSAARPISSRRSARGTGGAARRRQRPHRARLGWPRDGRRRPRRGAGGQSRRHPGRRHRAAAAAQSAARPPSRGSPRRPTVHQGETFDIVATVEGAPGAAAAVVFEAAGAVARDAGRSRCLPAARPAWP